MQPVDEGSSRRLRRIGRNFTWAAAGTATVGVLALLRTSVLTRAFSLDDYGRLVLVTSLAVFLTSFASVRVGDSLYSFYPRFLASHETGALRGLLMVSLALSLALGGIVSVSLWLGSPALAVTLYHDPGLVGPLRAYAIVPILLSLAEFTAPVLRLNDRFGVVAVSQAFGSLAALVIIAAYVASTRAPDLTVVVGLMALLVVLQGLPPLVLSLWESRSILRHGTFRQAIAGLKPYSSELGRTVLHTNLVGYLRIAAAPGDQFLLGLTASTEQVALYGLARQLTGPLATLQTSAHVALQPETTSLYAQGRWQDLRTLLRPYFRWAAAAGGLAVLGTALLVRPVIRIFATDEYLPSAAPTVILAASVALALFTAPAYPIGVSSGRLRRFNVVQIIGLAIMVVFLTALHPTATGLAVSVLLGAVVVIVGFAVPIYRSIFSRTRADAAPAEAEVAPGQDRG